MDWLPRMIYSPAALHNALVASILRSLAEQGFQRIVVWRGCGAHLERDCENKVRIAFRSCDVASLRKGPEATEHTEYTETTLLRAVQKQAAVRDLSQDTL